MLFITAFAPPAAVSWATNCPCFELEGQRGKYMIWHEKGRKAPPGWQCAGSRSTATFVPLGVSWDTEAAALGSY
jgi:hypothetical protein